MWLRVVGRDTCGPDNDRWTYERVCKKINEERRAGTTFILPVATIIETGNHIAHANGDRFAMAGRLVDVIVDAANAKSPWAAFTEQKELWDNDGLVALATHWRTTVPGGQSLGDASIVDVANYYAKIGIKVEILTGDQGLQVQEPIVPQRVPRRRQHVNP